MVNDDHRTVTRLPFARDRSVHVEYAQGYVITSYQALCGLLGPPAVPGDPDFDDDEDKVTARWGVRHADGSTMAIWAYKSRAETANFFSFWSSTPAMRDIVVLALGARVRQFP